MRQQRLGKFFGDSFGPTESIPDAKLRLGRRSEKEYPLPLRGVSNDVLSPCVPEAARFLVEGAAFKRVEGSVKNAGCVLARGLLSYGCHDGGVCAVGRNGKGRAREQVGVASGGALTILFSLHAHALLLQ